MTPKEKAKELYVKYYELIKSPYQKHTCTKQCALIAVDEIIESNPYKIELEGKFQTEWNRYDITYWEEVKKEIEAL